MPSKYWSVFTTGLQNTFVYRWNFLLRSLFSIVPLAGTVFIWRALFESRGEDIRGYSFGQMVYYFLVDPARGQPRDADGRRMADRC